MPTTEERIRDEATRDRIVEWLKAMGSNAGAFTAQEVAMSIGHPIADVEKALESLRRRRTLTRQRSVEPEGDGTHVTLYRIRT